MKRPMSPWKLVKWNHWIRLDFHDGTEGKDSTQPHTSVVPSSVGVASETGKK